MSTKEALRQLRQLFSTSLQPSLSPFPTLTLPTSLSAQIDTLLSQFAASFPLGGGGGHQRESEGERERQRWREGLLEIWATVEPLPGTESEPAVIARVSAFLVLLEKISSGVQEDDESALVSRRDIAAVWWSAILKRTMLGSSSSKDDSLRMASTSTARPSATRRDTQPRASSSSIQLRPLTVSRIALVSANRMIVWAMAPSLSVPDHLADKVTPFGLVVVAEYEERTMVRAKGRDERYGINNLEECIVGWGEKCPKAFFAHIAPLISLASPSQLSFSSLLLLFLSRYAAKSYHALQTPLLGTLIDFCLLSRSAAAVGIVVKCLAVFLVTLPVIIGQQHLLGAMAVYGRVVCWDGLGDARESSEERKKEDGPDPEEQQQSSPSPDPLVLFTILYGIYPCNFMAFLKDPTVFLAANAWQKQADANLDSPMIRERSKPLIRRHSLHPSLVSNDLAAELTDTHRWRRLETADVMAECDRNVNAAYGSSSGAGMVDVRGDDGGLTGRIGRSRSTRSIDAEGAASGGAGVGASDWLQDESISRSTTLHLPSHTHFANFQALSHNRSSTESGAALPNEISRSSSVDPMSLSLQLGLGDSVISSSSFTAQNPFMSASVGALPRSGLQAPSFSRTDGAAAAAAGGAEEGNAQIARLQTELAALQGEVNFQTYLKQLHLAHMGTLHRAKVLDSGAEAERQSLYRTIRTLRAQLQQTKSSLEKLRLESSSTKTNWIAHIDDLKDKVRSLREYRIAKEEETKLLRGDVAELKGLVAKIEKDAEEVGNQYLDLRNQVTLDSVKLGRVSEYEDRIGALIKTLSICDEDLYKFADQRREMDTLAAGWKRSELLRESAEATVVRLRSELQAKDDQLHEFGTRFIPASIIVADIDKDGLASMRKEMARLRMKVNRLEEEKGELRETMI